ncbi:MAG: Ser-Thr-rich GPI-anchored membrane family protein [Chloroflexota bacterium]
MKKMYILCLLCVFMLPVYANNAAIIVMTPNGGENWLMGCPQTIQWITAAPMPVKIELFRNGSFYLTIANQVPASQNSFSWTPLYSITPGNTFKIKISSLTSSSGSDFSDGNFSISKGTLTVTSPNGGEAWLYGTTHMILWNDNLCENVRIELWKGGSYFSLLTASTPSTGSFPWAIVNSIPAGSDYKIKIMSTALVAASTNLVYDFSDNNFTIGTANPCFVAITSPNGGEIWAKGTTHLITWQENMTFPVKIELWKGGIYKSLIVASTPGTGTYFWAIPMTIASGNDYKIKIMVISSAASYTCYDFSDNNFIIPGSGATGLKSSESDFHVFPNPCNDILNVKLPCDPVTNTSLMIMNVTGKKALDQHIIEYHQSEGLTINTTDIADGFYILIIRQDEEIIYKRPLVIKH